jgi:PTH1 family peptidyl-tRNA hydrolase
MDPLVVVGLGNPGPEYVGTRHNVGFEVLERLADQLSATPFETTRSYASARAPLAGVDGRGLVLVQPLTYMNRSGDALIDYDARHGLTPERLLVVVDDVYLPLGQVRLRANGSDGGHNGLASIAAALGTTAYARLRIGVGRGEGGTALRDHVLSEFSADEAPAYDTAVLAACEAARLWAAEGAIAAMNRYNTRAREERVETRDERTKAPEGER